MDMPAFAKSDLFKWNDFIQANTMKIFEEKKKNSEAVEKAYSNRLKRMGLLKANLHIN
jgi:hypothetical protein